MPRTSARRKRRQKSVGFERLEERALLAAGLRLENATASVIATGSATGTYTNWDGEQYTRTSTLGEPWIFGSVTGDPRWYRRFETPGSSGPIAPQYGATFNVADSKPYWWHGSSYYGVDNLSDGITKYISFKTNSSFSYQSNLVSGSGSLDVHASFEASFRIVDDVLPDGTPVFVGTRKKGRVLDGQPGQDARTATESLLDFSTISIAGLERHERRFQNAVPLPIIEHENWGPAYDLMLRTEHSDQFEYWKAAVGQSFTVSGVFFNQTSWPHWTDTLGIINVFIAELGHVEASANWTDSGVSASYTVYGELPEAPRMQLVWASSETTPETVVHEFVGGGFSDPQAGSRYEIHVPGNSLTAPYLSGSLVARVSPYQQISAREAFLDFQADVRFEWDDISGGELVNHGPDNFAQYTATKNKEYMPFVRVTNRTPSGVGLRSFEVKLSEFRSQGTNPSKDANPGLFQTDLWIPALAAGESYLKPLGWFSHNWAWIPDENPIDTLFTTSEGLSGLERDQTLGVVLEVIQNNAPPGLGRLLSLFGWTKTAFDTFLDVFALSQDSERTNTYRYILTLPDRGNVATADVLIEVPASRFVPLSAMFVLKAVGDNALTKAIANLIDPKGSSVRAGFWLAAATAAYMGARERYETAKDPPDPNFTETVELQYTLPIVGDVAQAEIDRHLLLREISAYRLAAYRARNKADGAELAGNAEWQSRQLSAAAEFAVEASRLERRLSILDMLFPQPADEIDEDELAEFTQRIAAEGLPAEFDSGLRAGGFSQPQIDGFRDLLASLTSLPASPPEALGKANQLLAINGFIEGIEVLLESVALKVTQPGASVLPVSAEIIAELDATDAAVQAGYRAQLANDAYETVVFEQLERVQSLLLATNNLPVLEPYLQRAATARVQLMARFVRTADVAAHIDQAVTAGSADLGAAAAVKAELDRAAGAFAAGSQDTAAVAATVAEVVASRRGNGIPVALADDITGWTASVSGKSRLAADSFVLEVGKSYDLDVLANDSTVAGRLVPGSLAIQDAAGLGAFVTVVDGKLRLNPTAAMAGRHTVRYSVFDDASYLRNSQAISLTVTTNGIFVGDGQSTTDPTTRTGGYDLVKLGAGKLVLDRANTHSGGTVIGAGEVIVRNLAALGTGTVVVNPGAKLTLDVGPEAVALTDLEIEAGGLLDVGMGRVVLEAGSFDVATIRERIAAGFGSGSSGITSAAAAAVPGRAVGHAVDGNGNLVVGFAAAGDLDMNGIVDGNDANALINSRLFDSGLPATWAEGDYDYNGVLDMDDVIAFVTGGMYDQGPYLPSTSGPTVQAQTASDTQADTIGKVTFEAGDVAISAALSPVDSSNDEGMSGISTPSRNDPLMDAAFAMLSFQEQSSTNSAERKKVAFLIL